MLCVDLKFLLYSINGVVFVFALVLISMGVNCTTIPGPTINGTQSSIIFGTSMILLGGLGITSVRLRQFWLSILFMIILICLLGGQLVMGIKALAMDESAVIKSYLKKLYSSKSKDEVSANVSRIQGYFKCCGYYGPDNPDVWLKDPIYLSKGNENQKPQNATYLIPECCPPQPMACTKLLAFQDSCLDKIKKEHSDWSCLTGVVLVAASFILFVLGGLSVKQLTLIT